MQTDLVLSRFWGILLVVSCGAVLLKGRNAEALMDAKESEAFTLSVGWIALIAGAAHVALYNDWTWGHEGIVTFLGWITLVRAAVRLVIPSTAVAATQRGRTRMGAVLGYTAAAFALGVYLLAVGLGAPLP